FRATSAQTPANPTIVSTAWLAQHLTDRNVVVLQVVHDSTEFGMGHVPGARELRYDWFTTGRDGLGTELPSAGELQQLFQRLGVSDESRVVIYTGMTGMAPMASRAFLTLDYLGVGGVSLLNGGLARWQTEGRPVSTASATTAAGHLTVAPRTVTVDADWVSARTNRAGYAF